MREKIQTLYIRSPSRYKQGIKDVEIIRTLAKAIQGTDQESIWVLSLNNQRLAVSLDLVALGGIGSVEFDIKILFRRVLATGAYGFTVIHNHPGDAAYHSPGDHKFMKQVRYAAQAIELCYFDDVVVGVGEYYNCTWGEKFKLKGGKWVCVKKRKKKR